MIDELFEDFAEIFNMKMKFSEKAKRIMPPGTKVEFWWGNQKRTGEILSYTEFDNHKVKVKGKESDGYEINIGNITKIIRTCPRCGKVLEEANGKIVFNVSSTDVTISGVYGEYCRDCLTVEMTRCE